MENKNLEHELFGVPERPQGSENANAIETAFEEAQLLEGLSVSVDPDVAEEMGAMLISPEEFEAIED